MLIIFDIFEYISMTFHFKVRFLVLETSTLKLSNVIFDLWVSFSYVIVPARRTPVLTQCCGNAAAMPWHGHGTAAARPWHGRGTAAARLWHGRGVPRKLSLANVAAARPRPGAGKNCFSPSRFGGDGDGAQVPDPNPTLRVGTKLLKLNSEG